MVKKHRSLLWLALTLIAAAIVGCRPSQHLQESQILRLATTTSTENSGLLNAILPQFEFITGATVEVVAVGTGQALALGKAGDADVLLVHAPEQEREFVAAGHGTARYSIMYNDFIIVGPRDDPANIRHLSLATDAMTIIASTESPWASRGDDSGTYVKEKTLWRAAGLYPTSSESWYHSIGQGMGATLNYANEIDAYTLTDRGTYLSQSEHLPFLNLMVGGLSIKDNSDPTLYNPYGIIPVHSKKHNRIKHQLALEFVEWLASAETREHINSYGVEEFGQQLFYTHRQSQ